MTTTQKAQENEHGVRWATSKSGKISIAVADRTGSTTVHVPNKAKPVEVWALYTGTHDLAPYARWFATVEEANAYANNVWRTA